MSLQNSNYHNIHRLGNKLGLLLVDIQLNLWQQDYSGSLLLATVDSGYLCCLD